MIRSGSTGGTPPSPDFAAQIDLSPSGRGEESARGLYRSLRSDAIIEMMASTMTTAP